MQIFNDHSQVLLTVSFCNPSPSLLQTLRHLSFQKNTLKFPNLGSGENGATIVFKHGQKSRFDSLACYSLIWQKNTEVFWHQSEAITAATVWNWSGKKLSSGHLPPVLENVCCAVCLDPTDCSWVSQDGQGMLYCSRILVL